MAPVTVAVGLVERRPVIGVELLDAFVDATGTAYPPGRYELERPVALRPRRAGADSFALDDVTIGIGFHWERRERQVFRGALRLVEDGGLTAVNDVPLELYVTSVISSEMSASCPLELLKAHAVVSRSWLLHPRGRPRGPGNFERRGPGEVLRWYGREAHRRFEVCADDHCQRYQGVTKAFTPEAARAAQETEGEALTYRGAVCDARFSKCCGGFTEAFGSAWDDRDVPYLKPSYDGPPPAPAFEPEPWILADPPAYCGSADAALLGRILPGFDQETRDFYRWQVEIGADQVGALLRSKLEVELGDVLELQPLERGASGRIVRLRIVGARRSLVVGKELEIRRLLSPTHLYSSAFVVRRREDRFLLRGAGWGHGVGLCQIGAAVLADRGNGYREILAHYYDGTVLEKRPATGA